VISHLFTDNAPVLMEQTHAFWENVKQGMYEVYLSPAVLGEISNNKEPKLSKLKSYLDEIDYLLLEKTDEVSQLAGKYLEHGILPKKSDLDRLHIAYAVISDCDLLLSWNFSHLANINTVNKVKSVNAISNYKEMLIVPPTMLLGEEV